jgi:hypothetical protein
LKDLKQILPTYRLRPGENSDTKTNNIVCFCDLPPKDFKVRKNSYNMLIARIKSILNLIHQQIQYHLYQDGRLIQQNGINIIFSMLFRPPEQTAVTVTDPVTRSNTDRGFTQLCGRNVPNDRTDCKFIDHTKLMMLLPNRTRRSILSRVLEAGTLYLSEKTRGKNGNAICLLLGLSYHIGVYAQLKNFAFLLDDRVLGMLIGDPSIMNNVSTTVRRAVFSNFSDKGDIKDLRDLLLGKLSHNGNMQVECPFCGCTWLWTSPIGKSQCPRNPHCTGDVILNIDPNIVQTLIWDTCDRSGNRDIANIIFAYYAAVKL